jgi:lysophospholipase L1-like esterase
MRDSDSDSDSDKNGSTITRRHLLSSAAACASGAWAWTALAEPRIAGATESALLEGGVVVFQGDSITDAGRNRRDPGPNDAGAFGRGYAFMIAAQILGARPADGIACYNRGISGNKVPDLDARWQSDAIDLKPDILSILIGVNDIWHKLNGRYDGTVEKYEKGLSALLARTREALPKTKFVICEPFVLRCGAVGDDWFPEFDERRGAAKRCAEKAEATWVPFQSMFDEAVKAQKPAHWAGDGVHPTMAGHALMAKTWIDAVKA